MSTAKRYLLQLWDLLAWVLVIMPIVTGGIWYKSPSLKLELTQVTLPSVALLLLALIFRLDIGSASSVRSTLWLWNRWRRFFEENSVRVLVAGFLCISVLFAAVSLRRHWGFGSGAADLGIFTSAIWNLTHGNGYISSLKDGMYLLSDHQSPVFLLYVPFFLLVPRSETLLFLQAFVLAAGALPLVGLARQHLGSKHWSLPALPLLYWAYQPLRNANAFDFHPETALLPAFLAAIYFLQEQRWRKRFLGLVCLVLALGSKESAGPVAMGIGLVWLLGGAPAAVRTELRRYSWAVIAFGFGVFLFDLKVVPTFFAREYFYTSSFDHLGKGLKGILLSPFLNPSVFWSQLFGPARLRFLFDAFAPFAFLPFLAPRFLLAALPGFLMLFLGDGSHRVSTGYHYILEPGVGIFWALIIALGTFSASTQKVGRVSIGVLLAAASITMIGRSEMFRLRYFTADSHQSWVRTDALPQLDPAATLAASGALVPHLATRFWSHHLPKTARPTGEPLDCIVIEDSVNNWPLQDHERVPFAQALEKNFQEEYRCRSFSVYRLKGRAQACLTQAPSC